MLDNANKVVRRLLQTRTPDHQAQMKIQKAPKATATIAAIADMGKGKNKKPYRVNKANKCMFCGGPHRPSWCSKFCSIAERQKAYKAKNGLEPCPRCILMPHKGDCLPCHHQQCKKPNAHGTLACPFWMAMIKASPVKPVTLGCIGATPYTRSSRAIALATATVTAESDADIDISEKTVACLLDSGAQRTCITRATVQKLNLKRIKIENTSLIGFGTRKGQNKPYDIVKVELSKTGFRGKIVVNALVVENLNPINMTEISSCAKKIHAKGIKLADARLTNSKSDTLNINMIIGNDYYYKLINHKIPTRRLNNIFIVESYFGACLAGPIPGSTRTPIDAVNNITLMYLKNPQHY